MTTTNENTTLEIDGAKLTVDTQALFRAWMEKHLGQPSASLGSALPPLAEGERYIGTIISADGSKRHHTILLPGSIKANWQDSMQWAVDQGGDLPDRIEQALMYACMPESFEKECYWSNAQHASDSLSAWCQGFYHGGQLSGGKSSELCAVAVRRVAI